MQSVFINICERNSSWVALKRPLKWAWCCDRMSPCQQVRLWHFFTCTNSTMTSKRCFFFKVETFRNHSTSATKCENMYTYRVGLPSTYADSAWKLLTAGLQTPTEINISTKTVHWERHGMGFHGWAASLMYSIAQFQLLCLVVMVNCLLKFANAHFVQQ